MADFIFQMVAAGITLPSGRKLLEPTWLSFFSDAKIGVIGHNGSGKSTLLKMMAGILEPTEGQAIQRGGAKVGYLAQEPQLDESKTVRENIELGLGHIRRLLQDFEAVSEAFGDPEADFDALVEKQGKLQDLLDHNGGWELDRMVDIAMEALRVPPGDGPVTHLSGGERRRVALCRLLLEKPDLLLLDEPTNHLDAESVGWLERHLAEYAGCVIAVTHDRYFLDNVAQWILELDHGKGFPFEGNYTGWLEQKQERLRQEKKTEGRRQNALAEELAWIRRIPRPDKPSRRLASRPTSNSLPPKATPDGPPGRGSTSRPPAAWATRCWSQRTWRKPTATSCSLTSCRASSLPAASSASSAPTGPARRRCSA